LLILEVEPRQCFAEVRRALPLYGSQSVFSESNKYPVDQ